MSAERRVPSLLRPRHPGAGGTALCRGHRARRREPRGLCAATVLCQRRNFSLHLPKFKATLVSREEEAGEEQLLEEGRLDGCGKLFALSHVDFTPFAFNEVSLFHAHFVIKFDFPESAGITFSQRRTTLRVKAGKRRALLRGRGGAVLHPDPPLDGDLTLPFPA